MFWFVLLFWLAALGYVPFHFRKTKEVQAFWRGFTMFWYAAAVARVPDQDEWMGDCNLDIGERGLICGIISFFVAVIIVLVFAAFTLVWAW